MAMSRIISHSLTRTSLRSPTALTSHHRHGSNKTHHAHLIEIDLDSTSDSPEASSDIVTVGIGMKKIEEAIHNMMVRHAAPAWLPFLPGYSYWVPPRASSVRNHRDSLNQIVIERTRILPGDGISEDKPIFFSSKRGWPSSSYFIEGNTSVPIRVMEMQVKPQDTEGTGNDKSNSEDEEG